MHQHDSQETYRRVVFPTEMDEALAPAGLPDELQQLGGSTAVAMVD